MENFTPPTQAELDAWKIRARDSAPGTSEVFFCLIAEVERLRAELREINDIPLARLQFPDGTVPYDTTQCADGWHKWCNEMQTRNARLTKEVEELRKDKKRLDWLFLNWGQFEPLRIANKIHDMRNAIDAALQQKGEE